MSDQASAVVTRSWHVPGVYAETRLDTFARHCLPHLSRREVERAISDKLFWINDQVGEKGDKLSPGDHVTFKGVAHWLLTVPGPQSQLRVPIVYEDVSVLVVDRPAGMASPAFCGRVERPLAS